MKRKERMKKNTSRERNSNVGKRNNICCRENTKIHKDQSRLQQSAGDPIENWSPWRSPHVVNFYSTVFSTVYPSGLNVPQGFRLYIR